MIMSKNIYKNLTDLTRQLMHKVQLPIYAHKFSKKDFTTYQLMSLLVIKCYERKGYRAFVDWLHISKIPKWLKLKKIPHFTTLQKFAQRLNIKSLEKMLIESANVTKKCLHAAIDATGLSVRNPSRHYEMRISMKIRKRDFLKLCFIADMDNQLILAAKLRKKPRHDVLDFLPLWNKVKHLAFRWFYMDRGYDKNLHHQVIFDSDKISFGCLKNLDVPIHRTKGSARKQAKRHRIHLKKRWRSLIESMNGVIKQKFGSIVYARSLHTQKVETYIKMITYNLYRISKKNLKLAVVFLRILTELLFGWFHQRNQYMQRYYIG